MAASATSTQLSSEICASAVWWSGTSWCLVRDFEQHVSFLPRRIDGNPAMKCFQSAMQSKPLNAAKAQEMLFLPGQKCESLLFVARGSIIYSLGSLPPLTGSAIVSSTRQEWPVGVFYASLLRSRLPISGQISKHISAWVRLFLRLLDIDPG